MSNSNDNCPTCGPSDLKTEFRNGRGYVSVPETFMADSLGTMEQQVAEGMAALDHIRSDSRPDLAQSDARLPHPSLTTRPQAPDFTEPSHIEAPAPRATLQTDPYYPGITTRNFSTAETDAADIVPIQFQQDDESEKPIVEVVNPDGHDRPAGGVRLILPGRCQPAIQIVGSFDSRFAAGIQEAIDKRKRWLRPLGLQPLDPANPERSAQGLGPWLVARRDNPRYLCGYMYAVAIVTMWNCDCNFVRYSQWRAIPGGSEGGGRGKPDNYGADPTDPDENEEHMSSIRRYSSASAPGGERCYRVIVDSPGNWANQCESMIDEESPIFSIFLTGELTVKHPSTEEEFSANAHWFTWASYAPVDPPADGTRYRVWGDAYRTSPNARPHHPILPPPPNGEDMPPSQIPVPDHEDE